MPLPPERHLSLALRPVVLTPGCTIESRGGGFKHPKAQPASRPSVGGTQVTIFLRSPDNSGGQPRGRTDT